MCKKERIEDCPKGKWHTKRQGGNIEEDRALSFECGKPLSLYLVFFSFLWNHLRIICSFLFKTFLSNVEKLKKAFTTNWTNEGECKPLNTVMMCGDGKQKQTRICVDGNIDVCTSKDKEQHVPCDITCPTTGDMSFIGFEVLSRKWYLILHW